MMYQPKINSINTSQQGSDEMMKSNIPMIPRHMGMGMMHPSMMNSKLQT